MLPNPDIARRNQHRTPFDRTRLKSTEPRSLSLERSDQSREMVT